MQVADVMFPALLLPRWARTLVAGALILGFPITLLLSWAYELTPEGIKRETDVDRSKFITADAPEPSKRVTQTFCGT